MSEAHNNSSKKKASKVTAARCTHEVVGQGQGCWEAGTHQQRIGAVLGLAHDLAQLLIHLEEGLGLHRQLALDVGRAMVQGRCLCAG